MAKKRTIRTRTDLYALTAASETIDLSKRIYGRKTFTQDWQNRVWHMYDEIGEVQAAASYMGDAFSQVKLWIGYTPQNDTEVQRLDVDNLPEGYSREFVKKAQDTLEALENPSGITELLRLAGIDLFLIGEFYLVGRTIDGEETWDICSTDQISINTSGKFAYKASIDSDSIELSQDNDVVLRIFRRHPRWANEATSAIRSTLTILEELLLLTLEVRATTMSRVPAGILAFPDSMELVRTDQTSGSPDEEGQTSAWLQAMQQHFTTPIKEPGHASAVVPFMIKADSDDIEKIRHITFGRDLSRESMDQRKELIERFATAINLPKETLTGYGGLNHWSAWLINDEALNHHVDPLLKIFINGIVNEYLTPRLTIGLGTTELPLITIGYDLVDRLDDPEAIKTTLEMHDRILLSNEATRKRLNVPETDAPEDDEYLERTTRKRDSKTSKAPPEEESRTASLTSSWNVAAAEREMRVRLQVAADAAMKRALERAGAKLRSLAQKDKGMRDLLASANVSNELLISRFPSLVAAIAQSPTELIGDAFDIYGDQWLNQVEQEEDHIFLMLGLTRTEEKEYRQRFKQSKTNGRLAIITALSALANSLMFDPSPTAPPQGEYEADIIIPPGLVRNSLIIAGGESLDILAPSAPLRANNVPASGFYSGPIFLETLRLSKKMAATNTYTWVYGNPSTRQRIFEPHYRLDGKSFNSWTDEKLSSNSPWPPLPHGHYFPGDHLYCGCDFDFEIKYI